MRTALVAGGVGLLGLAWATRAEPSAMRTAAATFLATLEENELEAARFPLHAAERREWSYLPGERKGIALRELDADERKALRGLLRTTLSAAGERRLDEIVALEHLLRERESTPDKVATWRDAGAYSVAVFGDVGGVDPWSWRLEGHHVVLHFTELGNALAITPHFLGSNPARSERDGKVVEPLAEEQALARKLVQSLTGSLRDRAVLDQPVPQDVLLTPGKIERFDDDEGISLAELDEAQAKLADALIESYVGRFDGPAFEWAREQFSNRGTVRFLWLGSTEPGKPHYYRLHSAGRSIEYVNIQNDTNHVHTLWREFGADFGDEAVRNFEGLTEK
ncbi:MAG: DUF3500 domain-containing protein [Planctomycetaceae bacterium]|nr:DUF3500 domain-containing protein [Planctomycetaceae bacterium]